MNTVRNWMIYCLLSAHGNCAENPNVIIAFKICMLLIAFIELVYC